MVKDDDPDILRPARLLLDRYGAEAALYANRRLNELIVSGDVEAAALWRRVATVIAELQRHSPSDR